MSQNNSSYRGGKVLYCTTLAVFNRGRTEVEGGLFLPLNYRAQAQVGNDRTCMRTGGVERCGVAIDKSAELVWNMQLYLKSNLYL